MKKTAVEAVAVAIATGGVAIAAATQLAEHHVSITSITLTVLAISSIGAVLESLVREGFRTVLYTCPVEDCRVFIRARETNEAELNRLREMATDHDKHDPTA